MTMFDQLRLAWKARAIWTRAKEEGAMEGKSLLASKTFWTNLLIGGAQLVDWAAGINIIPASVAPFLPVVQAALNIVLRLVTSQPIKSIAVS